jgi:mercuric ion transport protein
MTFPLYSKVLYPKPEVHPISALSGGQKLEVRFDLKGMTCAACEGHIDQALEKVAGVLAYKTSFDPQSCLVSFDGSKIGVKEIELAINGTGYRVIGHQFDPVPKNQLNPAGRSN